MVEGVFDKDQSEWALRQTMLRDPHLRENLFAAGFDGDDIAEINSQLSQGSLDTSSSWLLRGEYLAIRKEQLLNKASTKTRNPETGGDCFHWEKKMLAQAIVGMVNASTLIVPPDGGWGS